jgi:hypothetical protein
LLRAKLSPDFDSVCKLYQELHDPDYFKFVGGELVAGPVADPDGNAVSA